MNESVRVRQEVWAVLVALVLTAVALALTQLTLGPVGYPGFAGGYSALLALPAMLAFLVGAQVALVAGVLAAWQTLGGRLRSPGETGLLRARARAAVGAGLVCAGGLLVYELNFLAVLPAWWLALNITVTGGAFAALCAARPPPGVQPGDVHELAVLDRLRERPFVGCVLVSLLVGVLATLAGWQAERSLLEGLERGSFETLAVVFSFLVCGRQLGLRKVPSDPADGG